MEPIITLGSRLKQYRVSAGISLVKAAKLCDKTEKTIWMWERDEVIPRVDYVIILARAYGVSLASLLGSEYVFDSRDLGGNPKEHRNRLRNLRGKMSRREFAALLGVTEAAYTDYEEGTVPLVDTVIKRVCLEHGCTASWLLGLDEEPEWHPHEEYLGFPLVTYAPPLRGDLDKVPIPCQLNRKHTDLRAYVVSDAGVNRVIPVGAHVIVDVARKPSDGALALVSVKGATPIVRRVYFGADCVTLGIDSWDAGYSDTIIERVDTDTLTICGVVVWYQSPHEIG